MFSQNNQSHQDRFGNLRNQEEAINQISQSQKKTFYSNKQYKKFMYYEFGGQRRNKNGQKRFQKYNCNNANKKNRQNYAANIFQKPAFSLEEQMLFEKLWKGALDQRFEDCRFPAKQEAKNCCCHCQCATSSDLGSRSGKIEMLRPWMDNGIRNKKMKSVVR